MLFTDCRHWPMQSNETQETPTEITKHCIQHVLGLAHSKPQHLNDSVLHCGTQQYIRVHSATATLHILDHVAANVCCKSIFQICTSQMCYWFFPLVLWRCWMGDRKGIRPVKKLGVCLLVVMIWLELCTTCSSSCHHHFHGPLLQ